LRPQRPPIASDPSRRPCAAAGSRLALASPRVPLRRRDVPVTGSLERARGFSRRPVPSSARPCANHASGGCSGSVIRCRAATAWRCALDSAAQGPSGASRVSAQRAQDPMAVRGLHARRAQDARAGVSI